MKVKIIGLIIIVIVVNWSCGESEEGNRELYNEIKEDVRYSYKMNHDVFDSIKYHFKFKFIKVLEFHKEGKVTIDYQIGGIKGEWKKIKEQEVFSREIKQLMELENCNIDTLIKLKNDLEKIKVNRIWLMNNFDINSGKYFRQLDLRCIKNMNGLHFFYRVYETPLDSPENSFYSVLINHDSTGGILSDNIIWYSK